MMAKPTLYIDADACPVKEEVLKVSYRYQLPVKIVANQWLRLEVGPMVEKIVVSQGSDVADQWISDHVNAGDIVITQDIPLAADVLKKGACAIGNTGKAFTEDNIGMALATRELKQHLRETGEGGHYNKPFSKKDRSRFLEALDKAVLALLRA